MGRPVVYFEIGCRDSAKTREFYADLFDWQITEAGPASVIQTNGEKGIDGHITSLGHEPENYVTFYVEVDDLQAYLDKATALGGKMLVPPIEIPTGRFAWLSDPDGNIVGLLQPKTLKTE
jgi:predicted enzyme related to lactoylglutathione lyase